MTWPATRSSSGWQFDAASVATVGIMFAVAAVQQFVLAAVAESLRWLWALFGVLFAAASIICFVNPENTFVELADTLGFLFLCVGVQWTIRASMLKAVESTWWLELVAGVLMLVMAFWTSGQFFIEKVYMLLVFGGIWALFHGTPTSWAHFACAACATSHDVWIIGRSGRRLPGRGASPL